MKLKKTATLGLAMTTGASLLLGGGVAQANTGSEVTSSYVEVQSETATNTFHYSNDVNSDQEYLTVEEVVSEALQGNTDNLDIMLDGPHSVEAQEELRNQLERRGDFEAVTLPPVSKDASSASPMSTGTYSNFCTFYNGQTMGWYGKEILACHGWLDTYISGNHVAHYNPDLIPRGAPISVECAYALAGVAVQLAAGVPTGGIGWAVYGIGTLYNAGGIAISCG